MSQEEANRIVRAVQRMRRSRGAGLKFGLPTAAVLGAGAAVAIGSIPGGNGTITGCYATNPDLVGVPHYGALRVIDPSATNPAGGPQDVNACVNGEATITWNQRGPQGPQGIQGVAGARGAPGTSLIGRTSFGLANSAGKTFLKIEGIKGESTVQDHKGEILVEDFALSAGAHGSGGGSGAGKAISSFTITKKLDKASPLLFKAAATGEHFAKVNLSFAKRSKGKQQDYLVFKFYDVLISSVQDGTGHGGSPQEQLTLNFHKASETFLGSNHKALQTIAFDLGVQAKA